MYTEGGVGVWVGGWGMLDREIDSCQGLMIRWLNDSMEDMHTKKRKNELTNRMKETINNQNKY